MRHTQWHRGITIHRIHVRGDVSVLLFVVASIAAALLAFPSSWQYLALAVAGGLAVAVILHRSDP